MSLKGFSAFPGRAQPKISTWFSKSQSKFDLKGYKKKVAIKHEHFFYVSALKNSLKQIWTIFLRYYATNKM